MDKALCEKLNLIGHNFFVKYYYQLGLVNDGIIDEYFIMDSVTLDLDEYLQRHPEFKNKHPLDEECIKDEKHLIKLASNEIKERIKIAKSIFDENKAIEALELTIESSVNESLAKNATQIREQEIKRLSETINIKFSDYFSVSFPRVKRFTDLDREHAIYLAPPLMREKVDNYLNNLHVFKLPKSVIDSLYVVEFQKYDTMIDVNGNIFDFSDGLDEYSPQERTVENNEYSWFQKKITSVNHVVFDDLLDIESSLIFNLLEIKTISDKIPLAYLRYYFYYKPVENLIDLKNGNKLLECIKNSFVSKLEDETGNLRFYYACDLFKDLNITIDSFENHQKLIKEHNEFLDEQDRGVGRIAIQAEFGSDLYNNLRELEKRIQNHLTVNNLWDESSNYLGFVSILEESILIFNNAYEHGKVDISTSSIFGFPLSCEIILKAKLKLRNMFMENNKFTMFGLLIDYLYQYQNRLFKSGYADDSFMEAIKKVAEKRNIYAHEGKRISIKSAKNDIKLFIKTIRMIDELIK